jgi:hypothetical protein
MELQQSEGIKSDRFGLAAALDRQQIGSGLIGFVSNIKEY